MVQDLSEKIGNQVSNVGSTGGNFDMLPHLLMDYSKSKISLIFIPAHTEFPVYILLQFSERRIFSLLSLLCFPPISEVQLSASSQRFSPVAQGQRRGAMGSSGNEEQDSASRDLSAFHRANKKRKFDSQSANYLEVL